ncbi:hypothetical protein LMG29739_04348 [Paraburkholderia solisilvae]|uniref:Uncharacterized protein n=1 Tax=Paraburkholderia solisilvae TaxID=624376 RepID=A0A6J5EH81_9BURK|nr:hypothetical protein LMG29739_04348 [Paraburkholderia solisilvae]
MDHSSSTKHATEKNQSPRKTSQPKDRVESKGSAGSGQSARWSGHHEYDWMDHFSFPDTPWW